MSSATWLSLFAASLLGGSAALYLLFAPLVLQAGSSAPLLWPYSEDGASSSSSHLSFPLSAVLCVPVVLVASHLFWMFTRLYIYN